MKSSDAFGPSKNASQDRSAGVMGRLRPNLVTSTWRTPGGKATGFGRSTAWLRLVMKTVERAIGASHEVYPNGICKLLSPRQRPGMTMERSATIDQDMR